MQTSNEDLHWHRLHGAALILGMFRVIRGSLVTIFFLIFYSKGSGMVGRFFVFLLGSIFLGLPVLAEILKFISFRYSLEAGNVTIREGILSRKIRHIPVKRIHNINTSQGMLSRLLKVVRVDIETAGGSGTEASLLAISPEEVTRIQSYVREQKALDATSGEAGVGNLDVESLEETPARVVFTMGFKDIFLAGATTSRMGLIFVALYAAWEYLDEFFKDTKVFYMLEDAVRKADQLRQTDDMSLILLGLGIFFFMFLVAWLLSIASALVRWHGFTLKQAEEDLNIRCGLLTLRAYTIPLGKIQALRCTTSFIRRPLGLMQINVTSAGHVGIQEKEKVESNLLVPITHKNRTEYFVKSVWPGANWNDVDWQRVHPFTRLRQFRIMAVLIMAQVVLAKQFWWDASWWVYLILMVVFIGLAFFIADLTYRQIGYAWDEHFAYLKTGFLGLQYWVIPISKIQNLAITQTPFQRIRDLASLKIDVAGQGSHEAKIPNIDIATCWRLFNRFGHPKVKDAALLKALSPESA